MKMLHYKVLMVFIFQEPPSEIIAATCEDVVECLQTTGNMVVAGNLYIFQNFQGYRLVFSKYRISSYSFLP